MRFLHDGDFTRLCNAVRQHLHVNWEFNIPHLHSLLSEGAGYPAPRSLIVSAELVVPTAPAVGPAARSDARCPARPRPARPGARRVSPALVFPG